MLCVKLTSELKYIILSIVLYDFIETYNSITILKVFIVKTKINNPRVMVLQYHSHQSDHVYLRLVVMATVNSQFI